MRPTSDCSCQARQQSTLTSPIWSHLRRHLYPPHHRAFFGVRLTAPRCCPCPRVQFTSWPPGRICVVPTSVRDAVCATRWPLKRAASSSPSPSLARTPLQVTCSNMHPPQSCPMPSQQRTKMKPTCPVRTNLSPPEITCSSSTPGTMASTLPMAAVSAASTSSLARLTWYSRSSPGTSTHNSMHVGLDTCVQCD